MSSTIQIKRGLVANLPASGAAGEPIYTTDDQQLHFGTGASVVPLKIDASNVTNLPTSQLLINAQTGTTYTVVTGDRGKLVTLNNASAVAVTLPQAGVSFPNGWFVIFENIGNGDVTVTPTTSTIDGAASFIIHKGQSIQVVSDGTNYLVAQGRRVIASTAPANQFATSIAADGVVSYTQPSFSNLSGTIAAGQLAGTVIDGGTF